MMSQASSTCGRSPFPRRATSPGPLLPDRARVRLARSPVELFEHRQFSVDLGADLVHLVLADVSGDLLDQFGYALECQGETDTRRDGHRPVAVAGHRVERRRLVRVGHGQELVVPRRGRGRCPVSYTHLTLPTI